MKKSKDPEILKEAVDQFKISQVELAKDILVKEGSIMPIIAVLCYNDEKGYGMVQAPIMGDLDVDDSKDVILEYVIPEVFQQIKDQGLESICFSFTSEAWLRTGKKKTKGQEITKEDIQSLPKEEALMVFFETIEESEMKAFTIQRDGQSINESGDLVDTINLIPHELPNKGLLYSGRFTGILKKYKE